MNESLQQIETVLLNDNVKRIVFEQEEDTKMSMTVFTKDYKSTKNVFAYDFINSAKIDCLSIVLWSMLQELNKDTEEKKEQTENKEDSKVIEGNFNSSKKE